MAYKIVASQRTVWGECWFESLNAAVRRKKDLYATNPKMCTEGHFDKIQSSSVCPVPSACVPACGRTTRAKSERQWVAAALVIGRLIGLVAGVERRVIYVLAYAARPVRSSRRPAHSLREQSEQW